MTPITRNLAIIIGINAYQPQNGISPLKTAVNDASKLASILQHRYQYQVQLLTDTHATLHQLNQLLATLKQGAIALPDQTINIAQSDRLLFYFAGHGIAADELDNRGAPKGYLVPQDATNDRKTFLPMTDLHDALVELPCRHLLIFLDCCFAGSFRWAGGRRDILPSRKMYRERYDRFTNGTAQQVITSAAYDEKALDSILYRFGRREPLDAEPQYSPFAELLFQLLEAKPELNGHKFIDAILEDGIITATEIYAYLQGAIAKLTSGQTPGFCQLKKHDKGEYIFPLPGFQPKQLPTAEVLVKSLNPYRGLEPYERHHSKLFFGRTKLKKKLADFVEKQQLTAVVGASGSGKSSLVKAGLIPDLDLIAEKTWQIIRPIRPVERPFTSLNFALKEAGLPTITRGENAKYFNQEQLGEILLAWSRENPDRKLLIVIDQFEELITRCSSDRERKDFLQLLATTLQREELSNQFRLVVTLRSDFEPQFGDTVLSSHWQQSKFKVTPMSRQELREAIAEPAAARVMFFESPRLVDELIDEVMDMPGALPLLSFTLSELYLKYILIGRGDRTIAQADYRELGGVMLSLTKRGDRVCQDLKREGVGESTIRNVMLRMVATSGRELARRRVTATELEYPEPESDRVGKAIEQFLNARLIVTGLDEEKNRYFEPAHDELIRSWDRILAWKNREGENLLLQRRLTPAAVEWKQRQQSRFLWNADPYLDVLRQVLRSDNNWFNRLETEFVKSSIRQRQINRAKLFGAVLAFIATVVAFAGVQYLQRVDAEIRVAIASSDALLTSNSRLEALIEAIRAGVKQKNAIWSAANTRSQVILALQPAVYGVREQNRLEKHTRSVNSVSISPHGEAIASASDDGTIKLWSREGKEIASFEAHSLEVSSVEFSPDAQLLAVASGNGPIALWNLKGEKIRSFDAEEHSAVKVSFNNDGQLLVSAGRDGTVKLWNLQGRELQTFQHSSDEFGLVHDVSFSPDGQIIASGGDEGVKLWSLDGKLLQTLGSSSITAMDVSFSPDGKMLAVAEDFGAIVWRVEDGRELYEIDRFGIDCVSFSPDGKTIALAGWDNAIALWDLSDEETVQTFVGHSSAVFDLQFSSDGKTLVSASDDSNIKIWSLNGIEPVRLDKARNSFPIKDISFSPDGKTIATVHPDKTIRFWNVHGGAMERVLSVSDLADEIAISSNGQNISLASGRNVKILSSSGEVLKVFEMPVVKVRGRERAIFVRDLSLSPDGKKVAAAGNAAGLNDSIVVVWHIEENEEMITLKAGSPVVSFSSDSKTVAYAGSDRSLKLWREHTNKTESLPRSTANITSISFSQDDRAVAVGHKNGDVILWQLNRKKDRILKGHRKSISSFSFHPDKNIPIIASGSFDGTVKIWSFDGSELKTFKTNSETVTDVSFSPDGKILAAVDGYVVVLWNFDLNNLLTQGCNWLGGYFKYNAEDSDRHLCDDILNSP